MAHPTDLVGGQPAEEIRFLRADLPAAELGDARALDTAAEFLRHQVHSVTDAQHGDAEVEDSRVDRGRAFGIDGGGTAGEDERARAASPKRLHRGVVADE